MDEVAVSLKGINHRWPSNGVTACRNVSLNLHTGCLHALVGENGAGKTTLGLILSGVLKPDSGTVQLKSGNIDLKEKTRGLIPGIGLIRQRSIWPPVLSLKEAAVVGRSGEQSSFSKTAEKWNLNGINPDTRVSAMDAAGLQRAEMIAALMYNPEILILDEPSSAWEEGRGNEFYKLMKQLKETGRTVMLITHRLNDVFSLADQVTVMRHGHVTGTWNVKDIDYSMLTREMFGEEESSDMPLIKKVLTPSPKVLQARIEAYRVGVSISGQKVLDGLSFKLHPGEILGITGLREEGLSYLEDVISGNLKIDTGSLILDSRPIPQGAPGMRKAGLHYVPSDKTGRGASLSSTMAENMIILEAEKLSKDGWFLPRKINKWVEERREDGEITGNPNQKLEELSGGNIQKVILQRELAGNPQLLVVADPAWGLDERSRQKIHEKIKSLRDKGASILLLASELDEALELSDRMGILSRGQLSDIKAAELWDRNDAAEWIAGVKTGGSPV